MQQFSNNFVSECTEDAVRIIVIVTKEVLEAMKDEQTGLPNTCIKLNSS